VSEALGFDLLGHYLIGHEIFFWNGTPLLASRRTTTDISRERMRGISQPIPAAEQREAEEMKWIAAKHAHSFVVFGPWYSPCPKANIRVCFDLFLDGTCLFFSFSLLPF
jgi:hypothetical protein